MSEEKIIDAQAVEITRNGKTDAVLPFEFKLPEKYGSLPVPLDIKELEEQDRSCHKLYKYMEKQNTGKNKKALEFKDGALYGKVPGIPRPMCFEPGLETIMRFFQLKRGPVYKETIHLDDVIVNDGQKDEKIITDHIKVKAWVIIINGTTGLPAYVLEGSASTKETKHRFRGEGKTCPECGCQLRIDKEKKVSSYYYCWDKHGGCGLTFSQNNEEIAAQPVGKGENENPIDQHNTIEEMAVIRAMRKIIKTTGMSRYFIENPDAIGGNFQEDKEPEDKNGYEKADPQKKKPEVASQEEIKELKKYLNGYFGDNQVEVIAWLEKTTARPEKNKPGMKSFSGITKVQYDYLLSEYEKMAGA